MIHFVGSAEQRVDAIALERRTAGGGIPAILPGDVVKRIVIVFDERQDNAGGPSSFGAAIPDNIDVNGTLVGRRSSDHGDNNQEEH